MSIYQYYVRRSVNGDNIIYLVDDISKQSSLQPMTQLLESIFSHVYTEKLEPK